MVIRTACGFAVPECVLWSSIWPSDGKTSGESGVPGGEQANAHELIPRTPANTRIGPESPKCSKNRLFRTFVP
eukprot:1933676-Amphidinium_carterae.1